MSFKIRDHVRGLRTLAFGAFILVGIIALFKYHEDLKFENATALSEMNKLKAKTGEIRNVIRNAEASQRGFLLTGNTRYLDPYLEAREIFDIEISQLEILLKDHPHQLKHINRLRVLADEKMTELARTISWYRAGDQTRALEIENTGHGIYLMRSITHVLNNMLLEQEILLEQHTNTLKKLEDISSWIYTIGFIIITILFSYFIYSATRDLGLFKRLNKELALETKKAKAADEAKSEFLASMSHEIRTPMTSIIGYSELLQKSDLDDKSHMRVQQIKNSSQALLNIINDILDLSKLQAGKFKLEYVDCDPIELTKDIVKTFDEARTNEEKSHVDIGLDIHRSFPKWIRIDPVRVRQVLINLMGNGVKFTKEGSVVLKCKANQDQQRLRFEIRDTGIGIAAGDQQKLFQRFKQLDGSLTREFQGTGLGLDICKNLVELMDGTIGVESQLGKGSLFWFEIPYHQCTSLDHEKESKKDMEVAELTNCGLNVLVAEDNPVNQQVISAVLDDYDIQYTLTNNGEEAVEAVKAESFDLILMDIRMPVMTGLKATEIIRSLNGPKSQIPIVAFTADIMSESRTQYLNAGMNAVVAKPINVDQLIWAINNCVQNKPIPEPTHTTNYSTLDQLHLSDTDKQALLDTFYEQFIDVHQRMNEMHKINDVHEIADLAHALKGASSSLGLTDLQEIAENIQNDCLDGITDSLSGDLKVLKKTFSRSFFKNSSQGQRLH